MRLTFYGKDLLNDISISIEASSEKDAYSRLSDLLGGGNTHSISDRYSVEYESDMSDMQPHPNAYAAKDQKPKKWVVEKLDSIAYEDRYNYLVGWYVMDYANIEDVHYCAHCGKVIAQGETVYWDDEDLFCFNCAECYGAPQPYETTGWRAYCSDGHLHGSFHVAGEGLARKLAKDNGGRLVRLIKRIA